MKNPLLPYLFWLLTTPLLAQNPAPDSLTRSPANRADLMRQLTALPCGIRPTDDKRVVVQKISTYLTAYKPDPAQPDEVFAKAAVVQALRGVLTGGYGIGAVLVDSQGKLIHGAHNAQLQQGRSDLHAEMNLLTEFETWPRFKKYQSKANFTGGGSTIYTEPLMLYTSTEPCPMCFIRVAIVGVETRYVSAGPDDGMNARAASLPPFWYQLSQKHTVRPAKNSSVLQQLAHCLFFSFLL